jgi:DNA-binding winged helix-turn-helix (wHTH) protein
MTRLLIIQDPDSLQLLLRPIGHFLRRQVALVVVEAEGRSDCPPQASEGGSPDPTQPGDYDVYRRMSQPGITEWVPARVAIANDGRPFLREDAVCFTICAAAGRSKEESAAGLRSDVGNVSDSILQASDVELNQLTHRVHRRGREVHLGPTEYRLLQVLLQSPDLVFTREQLLATVWGRQNNIDERTVDVHVGRLRKALNQRRERDPIRTVRGVGYALDAGETKRAPSHAAISFNKQRGLKTC